MKRFALYLAVLVVGGVGVLIWLAFDKTAPTPRRAAGTVELTCAESYGQQGRGGEASVGGVTGLVLPGSGDPASLRPLRSSDGHRFYVYKAALAVSSTTARYATVSILRPRSAKLFYGMPTHVGQLANSGQGEGLIAASRTRVRIPVCGSRFTGFVGGIIVAKPTSVTFAVSSPNKKTVRVTVSIGTD
ncbi:MAG TPA: hypothetical protein VG246_09845 [Acidimicrobiales bacterium]|nr:hypothetical protein [Acidimicrobiales bacterium]